MKRKYERRQFNPTKAVESTLYGPNARINPLVGLPTLREAGVGNCRHQTATIGGYLPIYCGRECRGMYCTAHTK